MKKWIYLFTALFILVLSWEKELKAQSIIPEDSIRLRILANSDDVRDQWIKRKVRDAIIEQVNGWVDPLSTQNLNQARALIENHLPEIRRTVGETLEKYHFTYPYEVTLGEVPFPSKVYGSRVYPAGTYEALRITLGRGEGQNWWCVLFPPLCFVDVTMQERTDGAHTTESEGLKESGGEGKPKVEYAFFLIEWIMKLIDFLF